MKRDKKYLLIIDDYYKMMWYKELSTSYMMNAKIILQTYYQYYHFQGRDSRVIISKINSFSDYQSMLLDNDYIKKRADDIMLFLDK